MSTKVINYLRNVNAKLVVKEVNFYGKRWAIQDNADGYSSINVVVAQAPSEIKQYLEGDSTITIYPVASNVTKLCDYALASFPNIEDLYLFKNNGVVTIEDDLSYLENLKLMYVASNYVSSYSSYTIITSDYQSFTSVDDYVGKVVDTNLINNNYTNFTSIDDYLKSYVVYNGVMTYVTNDNKNDLGIIAGTTIAYFGASAYKVTNDNKNDLFIVSGVTIAYDRLVTNIVSEYTLTIPYVGDSTLTSEYVDSVIAMLSVGEKNAITKVVIPTDFTQDSADSIAWTYGFSALPNLNNNIWYGSTQYDFTTLTIQGSGTLTSDIVESAIDGISSDKISVITKVVINSGFSDFDNNCLSPITLNNLLIKKLEININSSTFNNKYLKNYYPDIENIDCPLEEFKVINNISRSTVTFAWQGTGNTTYIKKLDYSEDKFTRLSSAHYSKGAIGGSGFNMLVAPNLTEVKLPPTFTSVEPDGIMIKNSPITYLEIPENFRNFAGLYGVGYSIGVPTSCNVILLNKIDYPHSENGSNGKLFSGGKYIAFYYELLTQLIADVNWSTRLNNTKHILWADLDIGEELPTISGYTLTWYSEIDCLNEVSVVNQKGRYFAKWQ